MGVVFVKIVLYSIPQVDQIDGASGTKYYSYCIRKRDMYTTAFSVWTIVH